jgi:DNA-binding NtrC family response regulator
MNPHILFVDDEVPIRETLSLYFKMKKMAVTTAANGDEAKKLAETTPFTLVILDIDIAGENGLELLSFFKTNYSALPVIMFTSQGYDPTLVEEAVAKGANAYMSKGESLDKLMNEVQRVMQPA